MEKQTTHDNLTGSLDEKYQKLTLLTQGDFDAFLYDCDGTLADTMPSHTESYIRVAAKGGLLLSGEIINELAGLPVINVIEEINKRYNTTFDPVTFADEKEEVFYQEFIEHIAPIDYVVNHLKAHAGKIKIAVVSGGVRKSVQKTLEVLGIADIPETLVCAGETPRGKPFPDPFLAAAEKLGVDPKRCLVFEDGNPGVQAAEAAGMQWVRIDQI
ncbi:HAD family phosphatase [Mucilaginibacter sp. RS28]|uniref:HAD family phosphatase n=1 Tax=Mucilaginibacter straminoryzae TaxID=2932774 RepID=A0A9X1X6K3_9SPHI|nr:HAD family phosphatase [Mucilaginibacter straminoryzae]MCJ8211060.1 HAD family phosphatase [Mucilaginibacter straminoryzae]